MPFEWTVDVSAAEWLSHVLHSFAEDVGSVIPDHFTDYARIFHPVVDQGRKRRWADLAAENERIVHPEMQFHQISRLRGERRREDHQLDLNRLSWGSLPRDELAVLAALLAPHTTTDRCWGCVWDGYGQLHGGPAVGPLTRGGWTSFASRQTPGIVPTEVIAGPRVSLPQRTYFLLRAPLADLAGCFDLLGGQSPNIWWPADRAWCVATEIDFAWTYVAGSAAAIEAVLAEPFLEALPATPNDRFTHDSDILNNAPDAQ